MGVSIMKQIYKIFLCISITIFFASSQISCMQHNKHNNQKKLNKILQEIDNTNNFSELSSNIIAIQYGNAWMEKIASLYTENIKEKMQNKFKFEQANLEEINIDLRKKVIIVDQKNLDKLRKIANSSKFNINGIVAMLRIYDPKLFPDKSYKHPFVNAIYYNLLILNETHNSFYFILKLQNNDINYFPDAKILKKIKVTLLKFEKNRFIDIDSQERTKFILNKKHESLFGENKKTIQLEDNKNLEINNVLFQLL